MVTTHFFETKWYKSGAKQQPEINFAGLSDSFASLHYTIIVLLLMLKVVITTHSM